MSWTKLVALILFTGILGGTFALSEPGDIDILRRVGKQTGSTLRASLPENDRLTGPLAAFKAGDALPVEERVRVRIDNDQDLAGADVRVASTAKPGQVRLKGEVKSEAQKQKAAELALKTTGVSEVIDDLAVPLTAESIK